MKQFFIPTNKGIKPVAEEAIIRVEASSNYCRIFFINEKPLVVAKVLHWFEENLPTDTFCRIHRTHLVNRQHITCIEANSRLTLANGDVVQVSRRRKEQCRLFLKQSA
ncbi:MAG TPA: LytTR family DNA-binding domain-containing protein [Ferruginibacter sp.]|nr:LytTR family DNA-binding domain-containing protein [Ferruginibacter sp.]HMP20645.1 LytTR family DNA-binding domain-containing protein [Ferruginibacter sp.]